MGKNKYILWEIGRECDPGGRPRSDGAGDAARRGGWLSGGFVGPRRAYFGGAGGFRIGGRVRADHVRAAALGNGLAA